MVTTSASVPLLVYAGEAFLLVLEEGVMAMMPEEHAQQAIIQYPALQEVMQPLDVRVRAAVLQASLLTIRNSLDSSPL